MVIANFYEDITALQLKGAVDVLKAAGAEVERINVPGALEIAAVISMAHESGRYDAYVALGCVIRGETYHFEIVANESVRGLTELATKHQLAIGNGILTVENKAQAETRANPEKLDKAGEAAKAALRLLEIKQQLGQK